MADRQAAYLYRFLDDILDLFPKEDRDLFATYWSALSQAAADIMGHALEVDLGMVSFDMPTFDTERWDRYELSALTAAMEIAAESIVLVGITPVALANRAVFPTTLEVTTGGKIIFTEIIGFSGDEVVELKYDRLTATTVSVTAGAPPNVVAFVEGHDYVVNHATGTIQRTANTNIAPGQVLNVSYEHSVYNRDEDYTFDDVTNLLVRTPTSEIPSGATVDVSYVLDKTAGPLLTGRHAAISTPVILQDLEQDFTGLLPGRVITISAPAALAGTYTLAAVLSATNIAINEIFPILIGGGVVYTIDAYPYGMVVDKKIVSIPLLQDRIDDPAITLVEGVDYRVASGLLGFRRAPAFNELGTQDKHLPIFWAERTLVNSETPYRNFGILIDFYRANSDTYVAALKGLLYAFWTGSSHGNLIRGIHILLGLPFPTRPGTVIAINETIRGVVVTAGDNVVSGTGTWTIAAAAFTADDFGRRLRIQGSNFNDGEHVISEVDSPTQVKTSLPLSLTNESFGPLVKIDIVGAPISIVVRNDRNQDTTFAVPLGLIPVVAVGDMVEAFEVLTTGVEIFDKINDPGFITTRVGPTGIAKWFATLPMTPADIAKALINLEEHVFVVDVLTEAVSETTSLAEIFGFLTKLKPIWTDFIFEFNVVEEEGFAIEEDLRPSDIAVDLDLTTKVVQNEQNLAEAGQLLDSLTGRIEFDGFLVRVLRDGISLAEYTGGDAVEILTGPSAGTYEVLVQINPFELRLLPEPPALDPACEYRIFNKILALAHDAVNLTDEVFVSGIGLVP